MEETVLICLPFAGAGASFFAPWQGQAPAGLTILPVQLPGREKRFAEPAYTSAAEAVDDAYAQVTAALGGTGPRVAVFGHSMGAVLAYELAHRLEREPGIRLEALFVSGSPGPWTARTDRAGGLPEDEFVARVKSFAGYAHPALENPEMRELLLPSLRADVQLHENYRVSLRATADRACRLGPRAYGHARRRGKRRRVGVGDEREADRRRAGRRAHVSGRRAGRAAGTDRHRTGRGMTTSGGTGRLAGRTALITGAARGLGRACALTFAREGADLVLLDVAGPLPGVPYPLGSASQLAYTAELCRDAGSVVLTRQADVRDLGALEAAADDAEERFGRIDVLVNNAGIAAPSGRSAHEITEPEWQLMIDVDLGGAWRAIRAVGGRMTAQGSGSIVNIASTVSLVGYRHFMRLRRRQARPRRADQGRRTGLRAAQGAGERGVPRVGAGRRGDGGPDARGDRPVAGGAGRRA